MAAALEGGVKLSKTSPAFLHANSTSHTWIFSAIAELIDNSYDAESKTLWIDKKVIHETDALVFMDDGKGMSPQELHHMLSFGYCDKMDSTFRPVGQYGNGFKSGSMRLGIDAIVFTKNSHNLSVGFLSQSYLRAINSDTILVPIISWDAKTKKLVQSPDLKGSMQAITTHSIFRSAQELTREFVSMSVAKTGTRIIIYNLKRAQSNRYELDFESNPEDIINSESTMVDEFILRTDISIVPAYRRSLREYCSILFLRPRMKIVLRNCKVKTKLIAKSLSRTEKDVYNPRWLNSRPVKITFGFTSLKQDYGMMMYSKNRLIKAYEKVGIQKQANALGVGVVGVVQTDFLEPIHNKQDFNKTDQYNTFMAALAVKLNDYWQAKMGTENDRPPDMAPARPDWNWVQCDNCLKWRRLADTQSPDELPEKWYCFMNTDPIHNRCDVPEEPEDEDELIMKATYSKAFKYQKKNQKNQQIKIKEEELNQKEEYLQQVEQELREKVSQVPDLQKAKKDLEEAKRREKEQIQYIRFLKQREKQIMDKQQKLQENMVTLVNTGEPDTAGSSTPSGTKRKGSSLKVKFGFPKKKQKVVSEGEDFVITTNESDEEEKDKEEENVVNLAGNEEEQTPRKKKKKKKNVDEDVIIIDEEADDPPPSTKRAKATNVDVKPDVNELNKQMEAENTSKPEGNEPDKPAEAQNAPNSPAAGDSTSVPPAASPIPSTSTAADPPPISNTEDKDEPMDQTEAPAQEAAEPPADMENKDEEKDETSTPQATSNSRNASPTAADDEKEDEKKEENETTETSSNKTPVNSESSRKKTFVDQEVQVELKPEIKEPPIDAQEFKNCQTKLKDTKERLKSLRQNVFQLLKVIVPDLEIANVDLIEGVVTEMIKMNAERSGGLLSPIKPCLTNGTKKDSKHDDPDSDEDSKSSDIILAETKTSIENSSDSPDSKDNNPVKATSANEPESLESQDDIFADDYGVSKDSSVKDSCISKDTEDGSVKDSCISIDTVDSSEKDSCISKDTAKSSSSGVAVEIIDDDDD